MKAKNENILLKGYNSKDDVLVYIRKYSNQYNIFNFLTRGGEILSREEKDNVFIVIPWRSEKREFQGRIYEEGKQTCIEGTFSLIKPYLYCRAILGSTSFLGVILVVCQIRDIRVLLLPEVIFILGMFLLLFVSDIIEFKMYHNKKYENKILNFLQESLDGKK